MSSHNYGHYEYEGYNLVGPSILTSLAHLAHQFRDIFRIMSNHPPMDIPIPISHPAAPITAACQCHTAPQVLA